MDGVEVQQTDVVSALQQQRMSFQVTHVQSAKLTQVGEGG